MVVGYVAPRYIMLEWHRLLENWVLATYAAAAIMENIFLDLHRSQFPGVFAMFYLTMLTEVTGGVLLEYISTVIKNSSIFYSQRVWM